jgi:hypothetical protein
MKIMLKSILYDRILELRAWNLCVKDLPNLTHTNKDIAYIYFTMKFILKHQHQYSYCLSLPNYKYDSATMISKCCKSNSSTFCTTHPGAALGLATPSKLVQPHCAPSQRSQHKSTSMTRICMTQARTQSSERRVRRFVSLLCR